MVMKKVVLIITGVLLIALYTIAEQHRQVDVARGEWKTEWLLSNGLTNIEYPDFCFYCDYIKPLFGERHEQDSIAPKPVVKSRLEEIDDMLKNWPFPGANGNYIPSRDGLENSDTIVDGYPYNHI